jgi:hypothetical protein
MTSSQTALKSLVSLLGGSTRIKTTKPGATPADVVQALVGMGLVVAVDWRAPPDEIAEDLAPFVGESSKALMRLLPADASASNSLNAIAVELSGRRPWRLGVLDQQGDTFLVVRVVDFDQTSNLVKSAGLGVLRLLPIAAPGDGPTRRSRHVSKVPTTEQNGVYRSWKALREAAKCYGDHEVLMSFATDARARETISAHLNLAPKALAPVLTSLRALLDGGDLTGSVGDKIEAIRYYSFVPGAATKALRLLAELATKVDSAGDLRRFLVANRFPTETTGMASAARELPSAARASVVSALSRGLKSSDFETLSAALDATGQLGFQELRAQLDALAKSSDKEVSATARRTLRRLAN